MQFVSDYVLIGTVPRMRLKRNLAMVDPRQEVEHKLRVLHLLEVNIKGPSAFFMLETGEKVEMGRCNMGGVDWFVVKLNDKVVHQG